MLVFLLSLGGIPFVLGFWGKMYVFLAGGRAGLWWLVFLGALLAVVALFYYLNVAARCSSTATTGPAVTVPAPILVAVLLCAAVVAVGGLWPRYSSSRRCAPRRASRRLRPPGGEGWPRTRPLPRCRARGGARSSSRSSTFPHLARPHRRQHPLLPRGLGLLRRPAPCLTKYLSENVGLGDVCAGLVVGGSHRRHHGAMFFLGESADRWGVRRALLVALVLLVVGRAVMTAWARRCTSVGPVRPAVQPGLAAGRHPRSWCWATACISRRPTPR